MIKNYLAIIVCDHFNYSCYCLKKTGLFPVIYIYKLMAIALIRSIDCDITYKYMHVSISGDTYIRLVSVNHVINWVTGDMKIVTHATYV